jgi:hypothetical protein
MRRIICVVLGAALVLSGACSANDGGVGAEDPPGTGGAAAANGDSGLGATAGTAASSGTGGTAATGGAAFGGTGGTGINVDAAGGTAGTGAGTGGAGTGGAGTGGSGACGGDPPPNDQPIPEVCGNGLDDDLNGFVDEKCDCAVGQSQPCFGGYPSQANNPLCVKGTQQCTGTAEFHGWGPCTGWQCGSPPPQEEECPPLPTPPGYVPVDEDCDGLFDEGCGFTTDINIDGDCILAACPPQAPWPIGCKNCVLEGGDANGCISTAPGNGLVYFQEGDACPFCPIPIGDAGHVTCTLICSSVQGPPLNDVNCPIQNKQVKHYPTSGNACGACPGSNPPWCGSPGYGCPGS